MTMKKGRLTVTLELDVRRMTRAEAGDDEPVPFLDEYTPDEIARTLVYALSDEDNQAEMFAGSGMFVKITAVAVKGASWDGGAQQSPHSLQPQSIRPKESPPPTRPEEPTIHTENDHAL